MTYRPPWAPHLPGSQQTSNVLAGESLPRVWRSRWEESPATVAVIGVDGESVSNAQLEERSRVVAGSFAGAGLSPGDRIVVSAGASLDLVVSYVAALRLGLVIVPMNTGYTPAEVKQVLDNTRPRAAVVAGPAMAGMIRDASQDTCAVMHLPIGGRSSRDVELDTGDRNTPALICHTSGTTGVAKGAVLTSGNLLASAEAVRLAWRWTPDDRLLLALPLFHLHGLGVGLHGTLTAGASVLLFDGFDAGEIEAAVAQRKGSLFFGVPTMYHRLAKAGAASSLRNLRLCVSGSAPLPADLQEEIAQVSGQRVLERYGMTETVMNVSNPYDGERRPGAVGFPLPEVEVRLAAPHDEPGEIEIRGPNVFGGYWNMQAATAAAFTPDGWFKSGDIGRWDSDGYLRIIGRSKELIISGGYNVYPREIEDTLLQHPAVSEVAVVGKPSAEWGEAVVAFVVAGDGVSSGELVSYAAERLASYKRPRQIELVDELPRNALGKVMKDQLVC